MVAGSSKTKTKALRWVRLADALEQLSSSSGEEGPWERLSSRLAGGTVRTKASVVEETIGDDEPDITRNDVLPSSTWMGTLHTLVDGEGGVVVVRGSLDDKRPIRLTMHGLMLAEDDIDNLLKRQTTGAVSRRPGRPPANWWPEFAEELAVYVHVVGLPGPNAPIAPLVDKLLSLLADKGIDASRGSLHPIIKKVLHRAYLP